jgi:hypothetical protein
MAVGCAGVADNGSASTTWHFGAYCKPFFAIKAGNAFDVYVPALASKQDVNSTLTIADANFRDGFDA